MLSYAFPPLGDVGGLRCLGFSTYLLEHGWEPLVLTVRNPDPAVAHMDQEPPAPPHVQVYRSRSLLHLLRPTQLANAIVRQALAILGKRDTIFSTRNVIAELFCIPDPSLGWIPAAFLRGRRLIQEHEIDVIFATCRPFTCGVIGALLKAATGRPLIVDFRDPWRVDLVLDHLRVSRERRQRLVPGPFRLRMWVDKVLEAWVLSHADRLVVTSEEIKRIYENAYPRLRGRVVRIYNGFNDNLLRSDGVPDRSRFTICYSGNYYYEYDSSDLLLRALSQLLRDGRIAREKLELMWIGAPPRWLLRSVARLGLQEIFRPTGRVPREAAARYLIRSSLLLVRIVRPCLSTKLFEGLAAGVPLLATIEEGEAEELIRRYARRYYIVKPDDQAGTEAAVLDAFRRWQRAEPGPCADEAYLLEFNKKALTASFARTLSETLDGTAALVAPIRALEQQRSV